MLSPDGVLDEETIGKNLSNLGRSADGTHHVFLHLTLPGLSLKNIDILVEYEHLQRVEIPYNEVEDLSPLSNMPYLIELDASRNKIKKLMDFKPPKNLKSVDLSFNLIEEMTDLSEHHYLQKLCLDNNQIKEIKGLENCKRLQTLSLGHNQIKKIQGLENLPIKFLNLRYNSLTVIENLEDSTYLQKFDVSGNKIRSLNGLQNHEFLDSIDAEDNEVIDLSEVEFVKDLQMLRSLNLLRNPIQELPDYRLSVLYHLQKLNQLDRHKVEIEEKVASVNMFNPPMDVVAARDHVMHIVYNFLQPSKVLESTLPSIETPYPLLVLVGPEGSGKKDLALKLVEEFPEYFGYGVPHTTRKPYSEEEDGKDYHFVSLEEFEALIKMGKFIQTYQYQGNLYGLTIDSIEAVARDGFACVVQMELEGVLSLKKTYFEPRYVLIIPLQEEAHERRLRDRAMYSEPQITWTLHRAELYSRQNQDHAGFFDTVVNSDDITEAYTKLRQLVMDYLGISPEVDPLEYSGTTTTMMEKELTGSTQAGGSANGAHSASKAAQIQRAWSKTSLQDSLGQSQTHTMLKKQIQSPMPSVARGVVEEESYKRRQSAAKEAVAGYMPSIYDEILKPPKTVPQVVSNQQGLTENTQGYRSISAPVMNNKNIDALPPSSPDSSEAKSRTSSSLSNISDAMSPAESPPDSARSQQELELPVEQIDRLELLSGSATKTGSVLAPRPDSADQRPLSGQGSRPPSSNRIGSGRHKVLPPIRSPTPEVLQTLDQT